LQEPVKSSLAQTCEKVIHEFTDLIINQMGVVELLKLKTFFDEICSQNSCVDGPSYAIRSNYFKQFLLKCWPDIKYIIRPGLTDVVCSKQMTVDDEVKKAKALMSMIQVRRGQLMSSLRQKLIVNVLKKKAFCIKQQKYLSEDYKTEKLEKVYFPPLNKNSQKYFSDPLLIQFISWLIEKQSFEEGNDITHLDKKLFLFVLTLPL